MKLCVVFGTLLLSIYMARGRRDDIFSGLTRQVLQTAGTTPQPAINLFQWRLTLPTGTVVAANVDGAALVALNNTYFQQTPSGILFFTPTSNCVTSAGTKYCRSELRELNLDGTQASWGVGDGNQHTMTVRAEVRWLPAMKPSVVVAQVHGGPDDIIEVRCRGVATNPPGNTVTCALEVFHNTVVYGVLDPAYVLNTTYTMTVDVSPRGTISVAYQKGLTYTTAVLCGGTANQPSGAFFKTGAYSQSNETTSSTSVFVYSIDVRHISSLELQLQAAVPQVGF